MFNTIVKMWMDWIAICRGRSIRVDIYLSERICHNARECQCVLKYQLGARASKATPEEKARLPTAAAAIENAKPQRVSTEWIDWNWNDSFCIFGRPRHNVFDVSLVCSCSWGWLREEND